MKGQNQKIKSVDTITMASKKKKTDLEKALDYYKVGDKSITSVASQLKLRVGDIKIKRRDGSVNIKKVTPSNEPNSYFANRVKEQIVKRWKADTEEFTGNYKVFFKRYDKDSKKWRDVYKGFSITTTKGNQKDYSYLKYQEVIKETLENYDDADPDSFAMGESGDLIPVSKKGEGIHIVSGAVYSTASGGQRKVGRNGAKNLLKMRFTTLRLSKEEQVWDTGRGRCVTDFLIWRYKDESGFSKKIGKKAEEKFKGKKVMYKGMECSVAEIYLNELLKIDGEIGEPLEAGVSIYQLENFCNEFGLSMYAYDVNGGLIEYYNPVSKQSREPLIFTCYGEHFYPIVDKLERNMKVAKAKYDGQNYNTADEVIIGAGKRTRKEKTLIAPTKEEWEQNQEQMKQQKQAVKAYADFVEKNKVPNGVTEFWFKDKLLWNVYSKLKKEANDLVSMNFQNNYAMEYLIENEMEIPYPLTEKSVVVENGTIQRLVYDDTIVFTSPIDQRMKRYMEWRGEQYQGETFVYAMNAIWKDLYPFELTKAPFLSSPNDEVLKALSAENVKYRVHMGRTSDKYTGEEIKGLLLSGEAIAVDIKRCYCDCIYNQRDDFIRFTGREQVEAWDKKGLGLGLFFVETEDNTLFHMSNWYSRKIIKKAELEGIRFKITHQIRCIDEVWSGNFKMPNIPEDKLIRNETIREEVIPHPSTHRYMTMSNLFKEFCDQVVEETAQDEDMTLSKLIINAVTGYLGKVHFTGKEVGLTNNLEEVWTGFVVPEVQANKAVEVFVNPIKKDDKELYLFGYNTKSTNLTNGLPMYIQVLDWSNMALYDLAKNIGGEVVYRKTDMVISVGGKLDKKFEAEDGGYYQDTFGTYYQDTDMDKLQGASYNFMELTEERKVITPKLSDDWIDYPEFTNSSDWEAILKLAFEKGGLCIRGRAGTGKSYIIQKGIEAKLLPDNPATRLCFTNRAARNINGMTIHRALAITKEGKTNNKTMEGQKKFKAYVIDEISMINAFLWNKLMLLKKRTGAIFIILGDHRQCPPIEEGIEIDYFNHPYTKYLTGNNRIELSVPQRYDIPLWNWLEKYYEDGEEGDEIQKKKIDLSDILYRKNICYYNKTRKDINDKCMKEISKDKPYVLLEYKGEEEVQQLTYIYNGLPLMAFKCNKDLEIINTEEFWICEVSSAEETITMYRDEDVELDDKYIEYWDTIDNWTEKKYGITGDGGEDDCWSICNRCKVKPAEYESCGYYCKECSDIAEQDLKDEYKNYLISKAEKLTIGFKEFHKNFMVNYASTTHKSQGATISRGINIWDWGTLCQDRRIGYTAVSRAKTCDQVWINAGDEEIEEEQDADDLYEGWF